MKKINFLAILILSALLLSLFSMGALADADNPPEIQSRAALIMDAESGEIFFNQNGDDIAYPASTTKILTVLLICEALERGELSRDEIVTAYDDCLYNLDDDSSCANPRITPGEEMSVEDLLYCAMLASANEACNILAERLDGSVDAFVERMNARAAELGCTSSHFVNANGLEDASHYSSAHDLARIAREAVHHQLFLELCGAQSHTVPATNLNEARALENTNVLLDADNRYFYEYAYGIKTGYFSAAGRCLVSGAVNNDINIICVVLGGREDDGEADTRLRTQYEDTVALYDWVWESFSRQTVLSSASTLAQVPVDGVSESLGLRPEKDLSVLLPNNYDLSQLETQYVFYYERDGEKITPPVSAGDRLGEVTVLRDGEVCGTAYLVAETDVAVPGASFIRGQVKNVFSQPLVRKLVTVIIILFVLYLVLVVVYRVQRERHLRSIRRAKRARAESLAHRDIVDTGLPEEELSYLSNPEEDFSPDLPPEEEFVKENPAGDDFDFFL